MQLGLQNLAILTNAVANEAPLGVDQKRYYIPVEAENQHFHEAPNLCTRRLNRPRTQESLLLRVNHFLLNDHTSCAGKLFRRPRPYQARVEPTHVQTESAKLGIKLNASAIITLTQKDRG